MNREKIAPVILSGGSGTRLWPLSRTRLPKQMLRLVGTNSLIQAAALRAPTAEGFLPPVLVGGAAHATLIARQMAEVGVEPGAIILEPAGRNTAPAIALAALELDADALMLVMPSDQIIGDVAAFRAAIAAAAAAAAGGAFVTFGIVAGRPETGYGYIEADVELKPGVRRVVRFVEKPDAATAQTYLDSGKFYWNAGIFLIRAGTYLEALRRFAPEIESAVRAAHTAAARDGLIVRPDRDAFLASPSDSIDYAIMERAENVVVAPVDMGWSDIGAYAALWEQSPRDASGNAIRGDVIALGSDDCLLVSEGPLVAVVGVSGVSVVATGDAVLVVAHDQAQDVRKVTDIVKARHAAMLDDPASESGTWGRRRSVAATGDVATSIYELKPGASVEIEGRGEATLCAGRASLGGEPLATGVAAPFPAGPSRLGTLGDQPATVLVTISPTPGGQSG